MSISSNPIGRVVTPFGPARWPYLTTPDEYQGKRSYKTDIVLPSAEASKLIEQLEPKLNEAIAMAEADVAEKPTTGRGRKRQVIPADAPWFPETDQEGNTTGNWVFRFRCNAEYQKRGETRQIRLAVVDSLKRPVTEAVGGGSIIRVIADVIPYFMDSTEKAGVSLRLQAVQVKELRHGAGSSGIDEFDEVDGFTTEDASSEVIAEGEDY